MPNFLKSKHQKLILQCYPSGRDFDKKPNSSELSYLLFYASTRRLKLEKLGNFIEKKTLSDLQHYTRYGNVQVSLLILQELIVKCNDNLNLFIENCVRIFNQVLKNGDLILCQLCLKVFKTFVQYLDKNLFVGNSELIDDFQSLVINFLTLHPRSSTNSSRNSSSSTSWTIISIKASKYLSKVSTFNMKKEQSGDNFIIHRALHDLLLPIIFKHYSSTKLQDILASLDNAAATNITTNAITATLTNTLSRRITNAINATNVESLIDDTDDRTEDKINMDYQWSDEEIANECLVSLREYFETNGIVNLLSLTKSVKVFLYENHKNATGVISYNSWASSLYQLIIRWVNMQSRFLVMLNLIQELYNVNSIDNNNNTRIDDQILMSFIIADILHSDINLIGLSTLDILKDLLNLQFSAILSSSSNDENKNLSLLTNYYSCVSGLTNHIYYHDQISDIIHELLYKITDCSTTDNNDDKKILVLFSDVEAVLNCALIQPDQQLQPQQVISPGDNAKDIAVNIIPDTAIDHENNDIENYDASVTRFNNNLNNRKRQKQQHLYDLIKQKVYLFIPTWLNLSNETIFNEKNNISSLLWKYHCIFIKLAIIEIGVPIDDISDFSVAFHNKDVGHQKEFQDLFVKLFINGKFSYPDKILKSEEPNYGGILTVITSNCLTSYLKTNKFFESDLQESMIQAWFLLRLFGLNFILSSLDFIFSTDGNYVISESAKVFLLLKYMDYLISILDKSPAKVSTDQDLKNLQKFQSVLFEIQNNRINESLWDSQLPPMKVESDQANISHTDLVTVERPMIGQYLQDIEFINKWIHAASSNGSTASNGETFLPAAISSEGTNNENMSENNGNSLNAMAINSTTKITIPMSLQNNNNNNKNNNNNNHSNMSWTVASFNSINGMFSGPGQANESNYNSRNHVNGVAGSSYPSFSNLKTISRKPSKLQVSSNPTSKGVTAKDVDGAVDDDTVMKDATALINDLFYSDEEFKQGKVSILV